MKKNLFACGMIFAVTFILFILTLCPTFYWEDSAAFCAVGSVMGIPHSPGFPLYVVWARLFSMMPIFNSAFCCNLMSAFWGSLALALLYLLVIRISHRTKSGPSFGGLSTAISVLLVAFSTSFWLQTTRAEVYTLNIFLTLLLALLVVEWWQSRESGPVFKILLLFSFVLGISLANHPLLIITLVPAFLLLFFSTHLKTVLHFRKLILLAIFFVLGLSLYLYLPIRSSLSPPVNWGSPDSLSNLFSYLLRTSQPASTASASALPYLSRFWFNLTFPVDQFGLPFFWLGVVGAITLYKFYRRIFLFTFLIFILNVLTAAWAADFSLRNYDLLGYLLPSLCVFAIWFARGLETVSNWAYKEAKLLHVNPTYDVHKVASYAALYALLGVFVLLPIYQGWRNFDQCNKSSQTWAHRYAHRILSSVRKDALILAGDDNTLTSLWYLSLSRGERPDAKILSISGLNQKAYREQITRQYPEVKLPPPELKEPGETAYQICRLNVDHFPVYCTYFSDNPLLVQHLRPTGYIFEFLPDTVTLTDKDIEDQKVFLKANLKNGNFDIISREHFGNLLFNLGAFYDRWGGSSSSVEYFLWALDVDPTNPRIYFQLGKAFLKRGDKSKAADFFQAGLELDPFNLEAKRFLEQT
jgi:hypothetical protein